ncbi:hypothetical protein ACFOLJ_08320 [Rugamonas sp. CCM 8940]|uniref:hypothetical protein n=1 Tax=Rugamonas sp. CCM 8940 TaxID=2765359 RepID=UPI0018F6C7AF|nr:hypothetical protein [Rugamonas sp. CCM 8940]MBJ7309527.1 hypothetical protein [Rugamonas sp. CCM 8940]
MIDDDEYQTTPGEPAWCHPTRAKDMLHGSALFVRDMLTHDHDTLYDTYGIRPDEAAQSLRYVELAELRLWGAEEMLEAVTAVLNQASSEEALRRRIAMAMKAEVTTDFVHPGDAVLLLERSGLMLSHELREAVVFMSAGSWFPSEDFTDEDENRLHRLVGKPKRSLMQPGKSAADAAPSSVPKARNTWDAEALRRLQFEFNEPGMNQTKLAKRRNLTRPMIGKMLARAKEQLGPVKATAFDALRVRNHK